jgi:aspartate aminotransferase
LLPGSEFGRPKTEMTLRLSYVNFDGRAAMDAAKTEPVDDAFLARYCGQTLEAMHVLTAWFKALEQS